MDVPWLLLGVQKVYGLASATIQNVGIRIVLRVFFLNTLPSAIRRVLHLKMVTQCAMLEDFGIFLVLADKALFAYHIEALVPSTPHGAHTSQVPQKLSGTKDVHFFSVGTLQGRTLIIYMKKKSVCLSSCNSI